MGLELVRMVEEAWLKGKILGGVNATFIALIPKNTNPVSFQDYHPISLCNMIYKVNSKTIAQRMKVGLSRGISIE